ncbi:MAG TPA: glycosyltransferase 87 family protein [Solirubrobacteraceae bacterium]|nr:glycosyltransferase 87 family protein [Solirubrobacteraceae bacterium]
MSSIAEQRPRQASGAISTDAARRWAPVLAGALTVVLLAATLEIVLDGAVGHSPLIPKSPQIAGWLAGIGERLGFRVFLIALLAYTGAYGGILLLARRIPARSAIALAVALHAIVLAGPILLSTDVFSYIAYARMGIVHGINPYVHGPMSIVGDPVYHYVGKDWKTVATAYGPLYTLLSYPLGPLGVTGALWAMKLMALLASAGTLVLTWRCARLRKLDPRVALIAVGVNPLYVIYGLGGAHNDLIMALLMMAAVSLALARRDAYAGAAVLGAALVKATGVVLLPFMVLSRRRLAPVLGAAAAALAGALVAYLAFGIHGVDVVAALNRDAAFVSTDSFPTEIAHLFGKPGVFPVDHDLLKAGLVLIVLHLLWRTWRGYDWVAASGWTLLAISVTSTWLLAWYTLWSLPLAAVSRDRRLLVATLAVQALFIIHQIAPLLAPVS